MRPCTVGKEVLMAHTARPRASASMFLAALFGLLATTHSTHADGVIPATWSHSGYVGNMTSDTVDDLLSGPDFVDNYLIGYALAYDRPISARWSVGAELQLTYHFGDQTYGEIGLPLTVRYRPEDPWFQKFEGFAFGLGMSHATEVPEIETIRGDDSRRNLFYWFLESEFKTNNPQQSWFVRIHHRSDAWQTLEPEGGSNAIAIGWRHDF